MKTWKKRQTDLIRSSAPVALLGGSSVLCLVYFLYFEKSFPYFGIWTGITLAWNTATFFAHKNLKTYALARWISSLLWCYPSFFLLPQMALNQQAMWMVIVAAMACGSMSGNIFSARLSLLTIATYLLPITVFPLIHETEFNPLFSGLGVAYGLVLMFQVKTLNRSVRNEFDLDLANQELSLANERKAKTMVKHERLVNLSQVVGGVAHEINNPLSIIVGYAENIQDAATDGRLSKQSAIADSEKILIAAERASGIIKSLRKIANDGATTDFEPFLIGDLVKESLRYFKSRILKSKVNVTVDDISSEITVLCQYGELLQCFMNIISNSIDALETLDEKWIHIQVVASPEQVNIHFTDSGHGIAEDLQCMIMQPFFTTKEIGKGAGLGLSLASSIVESHGGHLQFDNKSKNTRFTVTLPRLVRSSDAKIAG